MSYSKDSIATELDRVVQSQMEQCKVAMDRGDLSQAKSDLIAATKRIRDLARDLRIL